MKIKTEDKDINKRIDIYISEMTGMSRSAVQKMLENGLVFAGGKKKEKNYKIKTGDVFEIEPLELTKTNIKAKDLNLDVFYEDSDLIVINKRQGMTVHPSKNGREEDTLVNALLYHCEGSLSGINGEIRPGIVHRLDRYTSGLMAAAKNDRAHLGLAKQIKEHTFVRGYRAVVCGNIKNDSGTIDLPLGRSKMDFKKIAVYKNAEPEKKVREAITHYKVLGRYRYKNNAYTYIELRLETGRTHQIRVHLSYLGHPVIGDRVYGNANSNKNFAFLSGQCLHSKSIKFIHPVNGERISIESGLPGYFIKVLDLLLMR